jgi:phage major head subunit gpT-like protein
MTSLDLRIKALQEAVNASLLESLSKPANSVYAQIATVIPATTKTTNLPIGLPMADMSHQDPTSMTLSGIDNDNVAVTVKSYYTGFNLSVDDLEDNSTEAVVDLYTPRIRELSMKSAKFYDKLIIDYLVSNPTTFTGEALFADSQTWGRGASAQDNLLAAALDSTGLIASLAALGTYKDHLGQVISQSGTVNLVVGKALEYTAKSLVSASLVSAGGTNVLQGAANVVVSEFLTDATDWYLTSGNDQLFIVEKKAPEVSIIRDEKTETIICRVKLRAAPGVGVWSSFVKNVVAG